MTYEEMAEWLKIVTVFISALAFAALVLTTWVTGKANKEKDQKAQEQKERIAQLQEKLQARSLTAEQKSQFLAKLKPCAAARIFVVYAANNREAEDFASQLSRSLREAGWSTELGAAMPFPYKVKGLAIEVSSLENASASCLNRALTEIGFPAPGLITPTVEGISLVVGDKL